jgi:5-bromo-4-chloroindolyl phosphate hydrolysis protein
MGPQEKEALMNFIIRWIVTAISVAAAVAAYYAAAALLRKKAASQPEPEPVKKEEPKLSPEVQAIIDDGKLAMKEMGRLYSSIKDPGVRKRINELMRVSDKIVQDAVDDPSDVPQIRKFLDYYLPTTIKLLNAYDRMSAQGIEGANLSKSMSSIEDMLDTAIEAFKKQLDSLFANQAMDIETDISVMNQMLAREGLSDEGADVIIKAARSGNSD